LWAVTGVSVLVIAFHEYHHHHADIHDHQDAFDIVLHGHSHEGSPDHDHQITSTFSASRTIWFGHSGITASEAGFLVDDETRRFATTVDIPSEARDLGPPAYLMHCVLLT
jgi:hypothetical protein